MRRVHYLCTAFVCVMHLMQKKIMILTDSHFHLAENALNTKNDYGMISVCSEPELESFLSQKKSYSNKNLYACAGAFSSYNFLEKPEIVLEYGRKDISVIERLLKSNDIDAVGEAVLDASTPERKSTLKEQSEIFTGEINLAVKYNKPLVVHCVKCVKEIFEMAPLLKKVPAVVFHGWGGAVQQAESLLNHGINCFFSIGTSLINGKKSAKDCASALDVKRLLIETDFPFCNVLGERLERLETLTRVYEAVAKARQIDIETLAEQVYFNFSMAFFNSSINSL